MTRSASIHLTDDLSRFEILVDDGGYKYKYACQPETLDAERIILEWFPGSIVVINLNTDCLVR